MQSISRLFLVSTVVLLSTSTLLFAGTEKVLFNDTEAVGYPPSNGLIFDSAGNLYGSAFNGAEACAIGEGGCGVIFKLSPQANGTWAYTEIYKFTGGSDGLHPDTNLVFDSAGNLYGATYGDNQDAPHDPAAKNYGTVFKLSPTTSGPWNFTVLYTFTGGSGGEQPGSIAIDSSGNLYGTTPNGGTSNEGFVFQLTPTESGPWNESVIHDFTGCQDGGYPVQVAFDTKGNLYGTAWYGGASACSKPGGVVFLLTPQSGGVWQETEIYSFDAGLDGGYPQTLAFDSAGDIYGTADIGGKNDQGLVFKLTQSSGQWGETNLHTFDGEYGFTPESLALGSGGVVYGTVRDSGQSGFGLVYELTPKTGTKETIVYQFTGGTDGARPNGGIVLDKAGNIYGGTLEGGTHQSGVIFEVTP
jgi:uncharacterized repeat protein (TIGR03803 family)